MAPLGRSSVHIEAHTPNLRSVLATACLVLAPSPTPAATQPLQPRPCVLPRPREPSASAGSPTVRPRKSADGANVSATSQLPTLAIHSEGTSAPARMGSLEGPNFPSEDRELPYLASFQVKMGQNCAKLGKSQGSQPKLSPFSSCMRAGRAQGRHAL